ncbi:MAG: SDR family oxidoreductase [Actinobacteria bacterium]|nr:SDR family oxidoreductase [Actinomycetota bacterium]
MEPSRGNRAAIVTGAGSGIGAALARKLAGEGLAVLLAYEPGDPREAEDVAAELRADGLEVHAKAADAASESATAALVASCSEMIGPPDVVVANAGIATRIPTEELTEAAFGRVLGVNLLGAHHLFRAAIPSMRERGWGRLLATSSTSGHLYGWNHHAAYCASKAALVGLVRAYAMEQAEAGITANAVAPGLIRSPQSLDPVNSLGGAKLAEAAEVIPARRVGTPEDVAAALAFLAGESAAYVNGHVLVVDGGLATVEPS